MASATSAATSILQSHSSTSQQQQQQQQQRHGLRSSASSDPASATSTSGLNGLDFTCDRNSKVPRLYFSSSPSISTFNSRPTITLDLTSTPDLSNNDGYQSSSRFPSLPKQPSTFLSFSSLPPSSSLSSHLDTTTQKSSLGVGPRVLNHAMPPQNQFYQPHLWPQSLPDKLGAEATKAISSNLSFHSMLAAAMTSFVGERAPKLLGDKGMEGGFGLNLKLNDDPAAPVISLQPSTQANGTPCASSNCMDKPLALSSPQGPKSSIWFPHSSVALSTFRKSAHASMSSPDEAKDHLIKFLAKSEL